MEESTWPVLLVKTTLCTWREIHLSLIWKNGFFLKPTPKVQPSTWWCPVPSSSHFSIPLKCCDLWILFSQINPNVANFCKSPHDLLAIGISPQTHRPQWLIHHPHSSSLTHSRVTHLRLYIPKGSKKECAWEYAWISFMELLLCSCSMVNMVSRISRTL